MELSTQIETWGFAKPFVISRSSSIDAKVVVVTCRAEGFVGIGESNPMDHYGESIESVLAEIDNVRVALSHGFSRKNLSTLMKPGAARNAVDCALWDLEAKTSGRRAWELAGLSTLAPVTTAFTLSVGTPEEMADAAANARYPILKLKLSGEGDLERVRAVRAAAPEARLIVDPNEAWNFEQLDRLAPLMAGLGVELIEQPLPAAADDALVGYRPAVPLCADEACHTAADVARCAERYQFINIKLDKTGGLTEALRLQRAAREAGLRCMVGCMSGTSTAMAPALLIAQASEFVDLDSPLLFGADRENAITYVGAQMQPFPASVWG